MLSDTDFRRMIAGDKLSINPLVPSNLSPVGYSLTVGDEALHLRKGIAHRTENVRGKGEIIIEPQDTVAIRTRERIRLSNELGGVLYAKVSNASRGLFHIAAAVHPGWGMASPEGDHFLVYVHNYSDERQVLTYEEPFCTLCLSRMETPAAGIHCRESARQEEWRRLRKDATLVTIVKEKAKRSRAIWISFLVIMVLVGVTIAGVVPENWLLGVSIIGGASAIFGIIWTLMHS